MDNIWRFFDNTHCISGIVFAATKEDAINRTKQYLVKQFSDINNEETLDICVWEIQYDDDYNKNFPYAVVISY